MTVYCSLQLHSCVAILLLHFFIHIRHLDISQNWFKEKTNEGVCKIVKIDSAQNNSDIGTKRAPQKVFDYLTDSILDRNHKYKILELLHF